MNIFSDTEEEPEVIDMSEDDEDFDEEGDHSAIDPIELEKVTQLYMDC